MDSTPSNPPTPTGAPVPVNFYDLDPFTRAYITAALWSSNDESDESGGDPFDANYDGTDIAPETLAEMAADCAKFQAENAEDIASGCARPKGADWDDAEQAGHDF